MDFFNFPQPLAPPGLSQSGSGGTVPSTRDGSVVYPVLKRRQRRRRPPRRPTAPGRSPRVAHRGGRRGGGEHFKRPDARSRVAARETNGLERGQRAIAPGSARRLHLRLNLSLRARVGRFTRMINAHSKTVRHHAAMTALFVAWYNYCPLNMALGKKSRQRRRRDSLGTSGQLKTS